MKAYLKKHWKKIVLSILAILIIFGFPFLLEKILYCTPSISMISNEVWFSFMGSYIGAIVTIVIFKLTIDKNNRDHRKEMERLYLNSKIDDEIELVRKIMNMLLLNSYELGDIINQGHFCSEYLKYNKDFWDMEGKLDDIALEKCFRSETRNILIEKMKELENMEKIFLMGALINMDEKNEHSYTRIVKDENSLSKIANSYREEINGLFEQYNKEMIERKYRE